MEVTIPEIHGGVNEIPYRKYKIAIALLRQVCCFFLNLN